MEKSEILKENESKYKSIKIDKKWFGNFQREANKNTNHLTLFHIIISLI